MFTHHQAMVYRRAVVEGQWFDLAWKIGADYAYTLDTLSKSVRVRTRRSSACVVRGRRTLSDTGGAGPTRAGANSPQPSQHVRCFLLFNNDRAICCDIDTSVMAGSFRNMAMPPDVRVAKTPLTRVVCAKPVLRLFRSANQIRVRSIGCAALVNIHAKGLDI